MNAMFFLEAITLDQLGRGIRARVAAIAWDQLEPAEASRLRHFGFDTGVCVESLHQGPFGRDPIAIKVGRMTVAIRRRHAVAILVQPEAP
jgi:ferrous iron transport protein A